MAKKNLTLPKDFEELLKTEELQALKKIFDKCSVDARGGSNKQPALAYDKCPHLLAQWLVEQGADLYATDTWGNTPLHNRSGSHSGNIESLLELGADVNYQNNRVGTPLHSAANSHRSGNTALLLAHGANPQLLNAAGYTPFEIAIHTCNNIDIIETVRISKLYLNAGMKITPKMQEAVTKIGGRFEFHRERFNKDFVDEVSNALDELYILFEVTPVPRRIMYDGKSPIIPKAGTWKEQHNELWELLVPSGGPATTVQGEVIRLSGKIARELDDNGGINWDNEYKIMADAFLDFLKMGNPLSEAEISEATEMIKAIKKKSGNTIRMPQLAVRWVLENPLPMALPALKYKR